MAVKIRMKMMGRKHRAFFRICATDTRAPRDGRVIEELGTYDPHVPETDARTNFNLERLQYWLGVGAQPSERVKTLIKKYGPNGTHADSQAQAKQKLSGPKAIPAAGAPKFVPGQAEQAAAAQTEGAPAAGADEDGNVTPEVRQEEVSTETASE